MVNYRIRIEIEKVNKASKWEKPEVVTATINSSYNATHLKEVIQKDVEKTISAIEKEIKR